jgi:predicted ArsR family transcriptional regulator
MPEKQNIEYKQSWQDEYLELTGVELNEFLLSEKLGINESAVQKHIDILKEKGKIERFGTTTGYWIIK